MAEYDAIIIGAGHNGLILGNYLSKAGLNVLVLERQLEIGGGLATEEVTIPGFWHNLHSYFHETINVMPPYQDLELERFNARYFRPPVQAGLPLKDGRCLMFYADLDRTCKSIARFSERDAKTYRELNENYRDFIEAVVLPALYTPPVPPSNSLLVLEQSPEGLEFLRLGRMSPRDVVDELFENDHVKALVLHQLPIPRGILDDYHGLGMVIPLVTSQVEYSQICLGGSHVLAHALWRALQHNGGTIHSLRHVKKIIVENGEAKGVELSDGQKIMANKLVVSAVDLKQTFLQLVGSEYLAEDFVRKIEGFKLDEFSIFGVHLALNEPPRFTAAAFDEDINQAFKLNVGCETPSHFATMWREIRRGNPPQEPGMYCSVPTIFDVTQAPRGKHTALIWQPAPYNLKDGGPKAWDEVKNDYMDRCIERCREYAPNLTKDNILMKVAFSPLDIERKIISMAKGGVFMGRLVQDQLEYFRPLPELSQHRTPIKGLYLCGACVHPGGGIIGAPGYNAANVIAEDLGLNKWWER